MNSEIKEKLIEVVRQHPCLFELKHKDYKNVSFKNLLWEHIGASIGVQGSKAKDMWRTLRDGYIRHKKSVKGQTGSRRKYSSYTWSAQMSFLDGSLELRPTGTNITESQECFDPSQSPLPGPAPSPPYSPTQPPLSPLSPQRQHQQSQPDPSLPSSSATRQHTIQNNKDSDTGLNDTLRHLHYLTHSSTPTSSDAPYLQPSQLQPEQEPTKSLPRTNKRRNDSEIGSPDNTERVLEYLRNKKKREWDSVDYLFMSYAKSFKALPMRKQVEIKVALAKLFADAELDVNVQTESSPVVYLSQAYSIISDDTEHQEEPAQVDNTYESDEVVDLSILN